MIPKEKEALRHRVVPKTTQRFLEVGLLCVCRVRQKRGMVHVSTRDHTGGPPSRLNSYTKRRSEVLGVRTR